MNNHLESQLFTSSYMNKLPLDAISSVSLFYIDTIKTKGTLSLILL